MNETPLFAQGASFLVAEDDALIVMMVELMLEDAGAQRVDIAINVAQANALVEGAPFDVAIFDRRLGNDISFPAAIAARNRGAVIIVASGSPILDLPEALADAIILTKPFDPSRFERAVVRALALRSRVVP